MCLLSSVVPWGGTGVSKTKKKKEHIKRLSFITQFKLSFYYCLPVVEKCLEKCLRTYFHHWLSEFWVSQQHELTVGQPQSNLCILQYKLVSIILFCSLFLWEGQWMAGFKRVHLQVLQMWF